MPLTALADTIDQPTGGHLTPINDAAPPQLRPGQHEAHGWEAWTAGVQGSGMGYLTRGKLPDVVLDPHHAAWYENILESLGSAGADLPLSIPSAFAGLRLGGPKTAAAAAMAVPTEIRESLARAYQTGEADSSADFLSRVGIAIKGLANPDVLKATAKAAAVGAATVGAGQFAKPLGVVGQTAAEFGTLAVAPAVLEGRVPEKQDFANAGVMIVGLKAAVYAAPKILQIFAKTGIEPAQVVADAKADPKIAEELKAPGEPTDIPAAYRPAAAAENAKRAVIEPRYLTDEQRQAFVDKPFADSYPQQPGEAKVDLYPNISTINSDLDVQAAIARATEIAGDKILAQTGGHMTEAQMNQAALDRVMEMSGAKDRSLLNPGNLTGQKFRVEMTIRGWLLDAAATEWTRLAKAYDKLTSSPEDAIKMQAAAERVASLSANFQGATSEWGRAGKAVQMLNSGFAKADAIAKLMEDSPDPAKISEIMKVVDNPVAAAEVARRVMQPKAMSTLEKIQSVWKAGLLSGTKIFQVKAIGDNIAIASGVVDKALASGVGLITGSKNRITLGDVREYIAGVQGGAKDTLKVLGANWTKHGEQRSAVNPQGVRAIFGEGAEAGEPSVPPAKGGLADIANRVINIPARIIGTETNVYKMYNEQGYARYAAARQAREEGLSYGAADYNSRVADILRRPTPERALEIEQAGREGTFTNKGGAIWKLMHAVAKNPVGGFIIPFDTVPAQLTKWAVTRIPGVANLLDTVQADFKAGGAQRDIAIARQMIGGVVLTAAYAATKAGILTGGGIFMTPQEREAQKETRQDNSIKLGGTAYSIARFEPLSRIMMLAADVSEMLDHEASEERASLPLLAMVLFGHATLSETYLSGMNNFIKALDDPGRAGPQYFDQLIGSMVPSLLGQIARAKDPEERRIDNYFDAIQSRLPILREEMLTRINPLTGEPLPSSSDLTPVDRKKLSDDPVLQWAQKLDIGVSKAPKSINIGGSIARKEGRIDLTPEQQNLFLTTSGKIAHDYLARKIASESWDNMTERQQKRYFSKVLTAAREVGGQAAVEGEQRKAKAREVMDKIRGELDTLRTLH